MLKSIILIFVILIVVDKVFSQGVAINNNGTVADSSAILDISSTNQGLLIPRMTYAERNAIANPANGLLILNIDDNCFQTYLGSQWQNIFCDAGCQIPPVPQALAATNIQQTSFSANWDTSSGATSYFLDVAYDTAFISFVPGYNNFNVGNVITYSVTGLDCDSVYYYRVRATNSCGTTLNSSKITTSTASCCPCPVAGFPYRIPVAISNASGSILTDYQVLITVTYNAHMNSDFSDLRFRDTNCTALSYWVESYTPATSAVVWVKVPSVPTTGTHIYTYYGNSGASSNSNGPNTFCLFEDFESGLGSWTVNVTGGVPYGTTTAEKHSGSYSNYNGPSACVSNCWHSYQVDYTRTGFTLPSDTYKISFWKYEPNDWGGTLDFFINGSSEFTECGNCNNHTNTGWYNDDFDYSGLVSTFMIEQHDLTNAETIYFDDLIVRKYTTPEPVATPATEENCP